MCPGTTGTIGTIGATASGATSKRSRPTQQPMGQVQFPELLVFQATPFCNINCSYCYLPNRGSKARMSIDAIGVIAKRIFEYFSPLPPTISIVWHAGEPLTMPVDWYRAAFAEIARSLEPGTTVRYSFQTNGTLLNADWLQLIRDHQIQVGISLDGPKEIHDLNRRTRAGKGTFEATMRGVALLKAAALPFHVIAVLTRPSIENPDAIFNFFADNKIATIGFNIDEIEAENKSSTLNDDDATVTFIEFFRRLLELNEMHGRPLMIRELQQCLRLILSRPPDFVSTESSPFAIMSVDHLGNCSTFSPELLGMENAEWDNFTIGNLLTDDLAAILRGKRYVRLRDAVARGVGHCRESCEYFEVCGGGAPSNKFYELGTFEGTETLHCRLMKKAITEISLAYLGARYTQPALSGVAADGCGLARGASGGVTLA
ncbi:MAG: cyclophane-forming radical SAM/SPASM peptide maturase GrrM/OscB [Alphaproteobacteria bacterium]